LFFDSSRAAIAAEMPDDEISEKDQDCEDI
jgi:hypothetical protein